MKLAQSFTFQVYSAILFLFPLKLLCARLLDDSEVKLIAKAQFPVGNRAFQEVLSHKGADDQGGVAVRASNRACGDVGFEGCKSSFMVLFYLKNLTTVVVIHIILLSKLSNCLSHKVIQLEKMVINIASFLIV